MELERMPFFRKKKKWVGGKGQGAAIARVRAGDCQEGQREALRRKEGEEKLLLKATRKKKYLAIVGPWL